MDGIIALFQSSELLPLKLMIFAFFIGACLAGFGTVYNRRTVGGLIRYLLAEGAFSPETAKTLRDAEQDLNLFLRLTLKHNAAFQRIVCMAYMPADTSADTPEADTKSVSDRKKKIGLSDIPLYINPAERKRAEEMYSEKASEGANMWMVLLSIAVFAVVAYLSTFIVPKLIDMFSQVFS